MADAKAPKLYPALRVGRYEIYDRLASGGMAAVHLGRFSAPGGFARTVALKRLLPNLAQDAEFVGMFFDEARLASRVKHPNVVPTLDVVAEGDEAFLVMEYVAGESLSTLLRAESARRHTPSVEVVAAVVLDALQGLEAAHAATDEEGRPLGLVHRDVSPQNILVGADGVARLIDFGIAKALGRARLTREGHVRGKLAYMPPEQFNGLPLDRRADLYAMGVVLWEALTARRLFDGDSDAAVVARIVRATILPPSTYNATVPEALDQVVERALASDLDVRFESAAAMAAALEASLRPASHRGVAAWVNHLAAEALERKAALVRAVESSASADEEPTVDVDVDAAERPTLPDPSSSPSGRRLVAAAASSSENDTAPSAARARAERTARLRNAFAVGLLAAAALGAVVTLTPSSATPGIHQTPPHEAAIASTIPPPAPPAPTPLEGATNSAVAPPGPTPDQAVPPLPEPRAPAPPPSTRSSLRLPPHSAVSTPPPRRPPSASSSRRDLYERE
jgi:serine/threonine-protein kinase